MRAWRQRVAAAAMLAVACQPTVVVGKKFCAEPPPEALPEATDGGGASFDGGPGDAGDAGAMPGADAASAPPPVAAADAAVGLPWSTGFEDGFCDYAAPMGFCLASGSGSYTIVTSPVHSGQYAAAFTVDSAVDGGSQSRCVVEGLFPQAAYYGAWYYIPALAQNDNGLWNLFHFQSDVPAPTTPGLFDVSLVNQSDGGSLSLVLYDFVGSIARDATPPVPIGRWFHIEVYFERAKDTGGQLLLFQDGSQVLSMTNLPTDLQQDQTSWGQWYVGNLATANMPPLSTIYVDDVTIGSAP